MKDDEVAYIAGIFDIAGQINVVVSKDEGYSLGYSYRPLVQIRRSGDGSQLLLDRVAEYADEVSAKYNIRENNGSVVLSIKEHDSIEKFLEPLREYFVVRSETAILMIEEVLPAVQNGEHNTREGFLRLMPAADKIRADTGRKSKYTTEYFEEEWGMDAEDVLEA